MSRITIEEMKGNKGTFRAVIIVPWALANLPGISGGETVDGPWVAGTGGDPHMALSAAYERLGRAIIFMPLQKAE